MTENSNISAFMADFIKAQSQIKIATKDAKNQRFGKYADITSVLNACMQALNSNNLAMTQPVQQDENGMVVTTRITHVTGEFIETSLPLILQKNDMQGLGSAITYARRYGLVTLLGIPQDDTDGNDIAVMDETQLARVTEAQGLPGLTKWEKTKLAEYKSTIEKSGKLKPWQLEKLIEIVEQRTPKQSPPKKAKAAKQAPAPAPDEHIIEPAPEKLTCPPGMTHRMWIDEYAKPYGGVDMVEALCVTKGGPPASQWTSANIEYIINQIESGAVSIAKKGDSNE